MPNSPLRTAAIRTKLPDGTRSKSSPWIWRGFAFLALLGFGLCITLLGDGHTGFGVAWALITLGWAAVATWLFRQQNRRA